MVTKKAGCFEICNRCGSSFLEANLASHLRFCTSLDSVCFPPTSWRVRQGQKPKERDLTKATLDPSLKLVVFSQDKKVTICVEAWKMSKVSNTILYHYSIINTFFIIGKTKLADKRRIYDSDDSQASSAGCRNSDADEWVHRSRG